MGTVERQYEIRTRGTVGRLLTLANLVFFVVGTSSAFSQVVLPSTGNILTVAGNGVQGYSGDGGQAMSAKINYPAGVAVDSSGNIYIADDLNQRIRKVTASTGVITTVAGNGTAGYSGDGSAATSAEINSPAGVAVDSSGNIYIADTSNNRIRKVTISTGKISTVAGNGTAGFYGDGGAATSAMLSSPYGVAVDANGNIYIADYSNQRIRKVTSTGIISTVAGNGTQGYSGDGGAATSAELNNPEGVALDSSGNIYIADRWNNRIRLVTISTGKITTAAGSGPWGYTGDGGPATSAKLTYPDGVAVDAYGNIYIADSGNSAIRKVFAFDGTITTIAGNGTSGYSGDGGPALNAKLNFPPGVALDVAGNIYIADGSNERVRAVGGGKTTPTVTWAAPAPITYGTALSATQLNASASTQGSFAYTPSSGTVLSAGSQTLSVTFTPTDTNDYNTVTTTVPLTVFQASAGFSWAAPAEITHGTALTGTQLNASANVPGTYTYNPASGTVLPVGLQILWVTFVPTDSVDYKSVTASVGLYVAPAHNIWDTGTVALTVNGNPVSSTNYGAWDTPSSVASRLAGSNSQVTVTAVGNELDIVSKTSSSQTNYPYLIQNTLYDSADFTSPSFPGTPLSGWLAGGADQGFVQGPVYCFTGGTTNCSSTTPASYDGVGNLTGYNDLVMGTWTAQYDTLNRLLTESASSGSYNGQKLCWAYDSFGNRTAQTLQAGACPTPETSVPATVHYNAQNQVTWVQNTAPNGFAYDGAGNVTADAQNYYLYDAEGRICAVASPETPGIQGAWVLTGYIYEADGTRVSKGTITQWSCDPTISGFQTSQDSILGPGPGTEQMTEVDKSGASMVWEHTNVWAAGRLIATYDTSGNSTDGSFTNVGLHFYLNDPLGTRRAQTDYAGVREQTCQSLPYGDALSCSGTAQDPTAHHFTGKERDSESGNDYFGARYYASTMGRFLSPDWSAKAEPVPYAKLDNPQTLNLYSYVQNNPLTRADADGHCYPFCTVAIGVAVGFFAGAGAEYIGEKLKGEKVDSSKIWHAGAGGALAGALTGLAGPEAGLAIKLGTSVGGQVIGGAAERKLNGEKVLDLKAGAKDAAAGLLGTKIDGAAEKTFASTFLKKTVPAATEAIIDAGQRG